MRRPWVGGVGLVVLTLGIAGGARGQAHEQEQGNMSGPVVDPKVDLRVTCPSEAVKAAVAARQGELAACYDAELAKRKTALSATSIFEWTVTADGRVANATTSAESAEYEDPALRDCVLARIARWTFPRQAAPVDVTLVAAFSPRPAARAAGAGGAIEKGALQKVIQSHQGEIVKCYEERLSHDPRLAGKVTMRWVVQANGGVGEVKVADATTLEDHALHECMKARIATWRFPRPAGGGTAVVTFPWVFRSRGGP